MNAISLSNAATIYRNKDPLVVAIEEIREARREELKKGGAETPLSQMESTDVDYLKAAYHFRAAVYHIDQAYPSISLTENRQKLDKKKNELNKKIEILATKHQTRENERFEARKKEEAKTKFGVIGPTDALDEQNRNFLIKVNKENTVNFSESIVEFITNLESSPVENTVTQRGTIRDPVLFYGPPKIGKSYLVKECLPLILSSHTFVTVDSHDLEIYGPILFQYAFNHAKKHTPSVVVLEDMQSSVYGADNQNNQAAVVHETLRTLVINNPDIQVIGLSNEPWSIALEFQQIFPVKFLIERPGLDQLKTYISSRFANFKHSLTSSAFELLAQELEMLELSCGQVRDFVNNCRSKCEQLERACEESKKDKQIPEEDLESYERPFSFTLNVAKKIMNELRPNEDEPQVDVKKMMKNYWKYQSDQNNQQA